MDFNIYYFLLGAFTHFALEGLCFASIWLSKKLFKERKDGK